MVIQTKSRESYYVRGLRLIYFMFSASTQLHRSVIGIKPIKLVIAKIKVVAVQSHGNKNAISMVIGYFAKNAQSKNHI